MKLSEAILLGSTILTPKAGGQYFPEQQAGCALGMAAIANGCHYNGQPRPLLPGETRQRSIGTAGVWGDWVLGKVSRPCRCWTWFGAVPKVMAIQDVITHLFDHHVMVNEDWSLNDLVEWVRSVETPDPQMNSINALLDEPEIVQVKSESA